MARVNNSNKIIINSNYFQAGTTIDLKLGVANSFYKSRNLDFRAQPSQMSVLPEARELSSNLSDMVLAIDQDVNGVRWGAGSLGNIYRIDVNNVISTVATMSEHGTAGMLYNQVTDQLYIMGQTKASMYGQTTTGNIGQPSFRDGTFAQNSSIATGCTSCYDPTIGGFGGALRSTASLAYPIHTVLVESENAFTLFSPDIEPGYSISPFIVAKGTGDWTLTLHDSQNNPLASVTKTNANLNSNGFNEFVFGKQVRVLVAGGIASGAANYHFHLTSTVNDGTVNVVPASSATSGSNFSQGNMMSLKFLWSAYRLVDTNNGWHPTALFGVATGTGNGQCMCIGNGQYLSTYNFSNDSSPTNLDWIRHQLVFKSGYEVCGLSTNNQYLVIAVERRSKNSSRNFQDGALYFWDGTTSQPSFIIDIPMGAPYGLYTFNNVTYFVVAGSLFAWSGGQTVVKVRRLAYQNTDYLGAADHTLVNPNMFTSRYNLLMMGYPSSTTNSNIEYGNWSWGAVELTFPNAYGFSYQLSNGRLNNNTDGVTNLQIGCNVNFVDSLYTSWSYTKDGATHYGLDIIDNFSSAAQSGMWMSLIFDGGARYQYKNANRVKVSFEPLPTGCTVTPFYILDRGTKITDASAATGDTDALIEINKRCHEIQYGFDFTCPKGLMTPPVFTGVTLEIDPLGSEIDVTSDS